MTESFNRNAYVQVGVAAIAVFVALLLVGAARGDGTIAPAPVGATPEIATPSGPSDRGRFGSVPDRGGVAPGGGLVPEDGGPAPGGGSVPAPGTTDGGGTTT